MEKRRAEGPAGLEADAKASAQRRANLENRNFVVWKSIHDMFRVQPEDFDDPPTGWVIHALVKPEARPRSVE